MSNNRIADLSAELSTHAFRIHMAGISGKLIATMILECDFKMVEK
jgi:hypothetical protein